MTNKENKMDLSISKGSRINIITDIVPTDAVKGNENNNTHAKGNALVIQANVYDPKVGFFHKVMFNAGTDGVIFKSVLASHVI
tara:strand:+ start:244 stop:492 length:249 start_codon:yes stop_codon:yes gene_type:complete